ncbi:MAG TPA: hypothetical protein PLH83_01980 [Ruminococcus sp.]|nr:hypothetical protein [Ruminococcus sp.]
MDITENRRRVLHEIINAGETLRKLFAPAFLVGAWTAVSYARKMLETSAKGAVAKEDPKAADKPLEQSLAAAPFMLRMSGITPLADRIKSTMQSGGFSDRDLADIMNETLEQFDKSADLVIGEGYTGNFLIGSLSILAGYEEQVGNICFALKGERPGDERRAALIGTVSKEIMSRFPSGAPKELIEALESEMADLRECMDSCYNAYQEMKGK